MIKSDLIIQEPQKPIINRIIVALIFASFINYCFYLVFYKDILNHNDIWQIIFYLIILLYIFVFVSIPYVASHSIHINFELKKIRHQNKIGVLNYKERWQDLKKLKYISVFL